MSAKTTSGENGTAARLNISLPAGLKSRMDAVKVNWSAVAAAAFERKLKELEATKKPKDLDGVILRLKAAAEIEASEDYQAGAKSGREWAKREASPKHLRRLQEMADDRQYGVEGQLEIWTNGMNRGIADGLFGVLEPNSRDDWGITRSTFWEIALGDDQDKIEDWSFARGFCDGALEIWEAVESKL